MSTRLFARAMLMLWPGLAAAQQLRGTVRDSASGQPISGAVIMVYGNERALVGRNITDETGAWRVTLAGAPQSVRVTRIGFRPREVIVPEGGGPLDLRLALIPTLLESVQVVAAPSACPRRADAAQTGGLLDQARAALLATVVAREANPAAVTRLAYERMLDANGERVESQSVRMESADQATVSFNAVQTAVDFAERGFAGAPGARRDFYGPDADVLLDDGFAGAYCFRIADRDPARPALIGLGFAPATRRGGRVDIEGALWVDTVARRLSHVEFRYLGLDELSQGFGPGGRVSFREVAPGIVLIDSWQLRIVGGIDAEAAARANVAGSRTYVVSEIGGELAYAEWPNGRVWAAPLGSVRFMARRQGGEPARDVTLGLTGTDYATKTDSAGQADIHFLVPGTYSVTVADPKLAVIGVTIPADLTFSSVRDSMALHDIVVPTAEEFAAQVCRASGRVAEESAWIIGRVGGSNGAPVPNAKWSVARSAGAGWEPVVQGGTAAGNGLFSHCRSLKLGETVQVRAWRERQSPAVAVSRLADRLTVLPVRLPTAVVARGRGPAATLSGIVRDSSTNAGVAGAFIEIAGTNLTAITDSAGAFTIADVTPGEYTAEIRTNTLDSLGAVARSEFAFASAAAPVRLFVPTGAELMRAMCGPSAKAGTGVLIGTARAPGDGPTPPNVRVLAEWNEESPAPGDSTLRLNWLRTRVDETGTFRLCGLPVATALTIRTQLDSGSAFAARPVPARFDDGQTFAFTDVRLETGLVVGAAFSGVVVADSTEDPVADAEVSVAGLSRSAATSRDGTFRLNDIPAGTHRVTIRRAGFAPITADVDFVANQTVDHRVVLGRPVAALAAVEITAAEASGNPDFDSHRKLGIGKFLTRDELDNMPERRLGDILAMTSSLGIPAVSNGTHSWLVGRRAVYRLGPPPSGGAGGVEGRGPAVNPRTACATRHDGAVICSTTVEDFKDLGVYCPAGGEGAQGIRCACYAQVYVDGRLMNKQRPTEPFNLNSFQSDEIEGVEWYSSPSQTPARYSSLNSACGVMAIWTRRRG